MFKIVPLTKEIEHEYSDFILSQVNSMFYHSLKYLRFLELYLNANNRTLICVNNGKIEGVLPLMSKATEMGIVYNSLPYYGSNGSVLASTDKAKSYLFDAYNELVENESVLSSCLINTPFKNAEQKVLSNYSDYRIGQITQIPKFSEKFEEALFGVIDSSCRRNIRKARKSNVEVVIDNSAESMNTLYSIHVENMELIGGNAKTKKFFDLIPSIFDEGKDFNIFTASIDGKVVSKLLLFYFKDTVEYFTPATYGEFRNIQPMSQVLYKAFLESSKQGYKYWNWGGTWITQEGVYKFKKKWGAQDKRYDYYIQLNNHKVLNESATTIMNLAKGFYILPFSELINEN